MFKHEVPIDHFLAVDRAQHAFVALLGYRGRPSHLISRYLRAVDSRVSKVRASFLPYLGAYCAVYGVSVALWKFFLIDDVGPSIRAVMYIKRAGRYVQ